MKVASVSDYREIARRRLPKILFDYLDGGAGAEFTLDQNLKSFEGIKLRPRVLKDVAEIDPSVTLFGRKFQMPVILAPVGLAGAAAPRGELSAAKAAAERGIVSVVSTASSMKLEDVASSTPDKQWFQLYPWGDRDEIISLMRRASQAGYETLVVTIDVPVTGKRERDIRNGFTVPPRPS